MEHNERILLIEDDSLLSGLLKFALESHHYPVTQAGTGQAALLRLKKKPLPTLVLLDLVLPDMDGFRILAHIRKMKDPAVARMPVIILSNLGTRAHRERAKQLGATDYFIKAQFTPAEIVEKIGRRQC